MIPTKIEDLTPGFFEECLRLKLGADLKVVCADVAPAFPSKLGFLSTHARATVVVTATTGNNGKRDTGDADNKRLLLSLFAKLIPLDDEEFMQFLAVSRYDVREIKFFEDLAAALTAFLEPRCDWTLPIPRLAFSRHSLDEPKSVLVLHDAAEDGFRPRCMSLGWDLPHLLVGVRTLARINAASMAYMTSHGLDVGGMLDKFPGLTVDFSVYDPDMAYHRGCVDVVLGDLARFGEGRRGDEEELVASLESTRDWGFDFMKARCEKALEGPYVGLAQRDCWNNNFMFRYDPGSGEPCEALLCDWQWVSLFSVTSDLASLLYTSVESDLRAKCMDYVLEEYFRALNFALHALGSPMRSDFGEFMRAFRDVGLFQAFETLKYTRVAYARSDVKFAGNPIMRRFCAGVRDVLRDRLKWKLW